MSFYEIIVLKDILSMLEVSRSRTVSWSMDTLRDTSSGTGLMVNNVNVWLEREHFYSSWGGHSRSLHPCLWRQWGDMVQSKDDLFHRRCHITWNLHYWAQGGMVWVPLVYSAVIHLWSSNVKKSTKQWSRNNVIFSDLYYCFYLLWYLLLDSCMCNVQIKNCLGDWESISRTLWHLWKVPFCL